MMAVQIRTTGRRRSVSKGDKKLELLAGVPLFANLRGRDLERLGQLTEEIDVPAGKVLTREGARGDEFFVIVDGSVRIERAGAALGTFGAGEYIGEIALLDEGPRTATATCETACRLIIIGHREFHTLLDEQPDIERTLLRTLAHRVRRLEPDSAG
jgi:CRP/FNR family transcriptional regulator, cyclic AMP receptor protein